MSKSRFFKIPINFKEIKIEYYLIHFLRDINNYINFSNPLFSQGNKLVSPTSFKQIDIKTPDGFNIIESEGRKIKPQKIILKREILEYDIFYLYISYTHIIISELVKNEFISFNVTEITFNPLPDFIEIKNN